MVYRGPRVRWRAALGIKPTEADHRFVASLSLMGVTQREILKRVGERFGLGKPMAFSTFYHHFKADLTPAPRGRKAGQASVRRRANADLGGELQKMIGQTRARNGTDKA